MEDDGLVARVIERFDYLCELIAAWDDADPSYGYGRKRREELAAAAKAKPVLGNDYDWRERRANLAAFLGREAFARDVDDKPFADARSGAIKWGDSALRSAVDQLATRLNQEAPPPKSQRKNFGRTKVGRPGDDDVARRRKRVNELDKTKTQGGILDALIKDGFENVTIETVKSDRAWLAEKRGNKSQLISPPKTKKRRGK